MVFGWITFNEVLKIILDKLSSAV